LKPMNATTYKRSCNDCIILVSEWDTIYGQSLSKTFKSALHNSTTQIHEYCYLRGLDGKVAREQKDHSGKQDGQNIEGGSVA